MEQQGLLSIFILILEGEPVVLQTVVGYQLPSALINPNLLNYLRDRGILAKCGEPQATHPCPSWKLMHFYVFDLCSIFHPKELKVAYIVSALHFILTTAL